MLNNKVMEFGFIIVQSPPSTNVKEQGFIKCESMFPGKGYINTSCIGMIERVKADILVNHWYERRCIPTKGRWSTSEF